MSMLGAVFASLLSVTQPESSRIQLTDCSFGEAYSFSTPKCTASILNTSDHSIRVEIRPEWGEDKVVESILTIKPRESVQTTLVISVGNHVGRATHFFEVRDLSIDKSKDDDKKRIYLKATGFAMTAFDDPRPKVELGSIRLGGGDIGSKVFRLSTNETKHFKINRVLRAPAELEVEVDGAEIRVKPLVGATWGAISGYIELSVDTPHQNEVWVAIEGNLHGPVSPERNPVALGVISASSNANVALTSLRDLDGNPVAVKSVTVSEVDASVTVGDCEPVEASCKVLSMKMAPSQTPGPFHGSVTVAFQDFRKHLRLDVGGIYSVENRNSSRESLPKYQAAVDKSNLINSGAIWVPKYLAPLGNSSNSSDVGALDSIAATQKVPDDSPSGSGPLLKWRVIDERVVYGYQVFRSDEERAPFVLLNVPAIAAKSSSKAGATYQWRDTSAVKGKTYWYYVGVVYNDGRKERVTPTMKATAK